MSDIANFLNADATSEAGLTVALLRGREVRILGPLDWPVDVIEKLQDGKISGRFRQCLIPEDRAVWDEVDPTSRDLIGLFQALSDAYGLSVGEHPAS